VLSFWQYNKHFPFSEHKSLYSTSNQCRKLSMVCAIKYFRISNNMFLWDFFANPQLGFLQTSLTKASDFNIKFTVILALFPNIEAELPWSGFKNRKQVLKVPCRQIGLAWEWYHRKGLDYQKYTNCYML
jgi:hypothetical protein